MGFPEATAIIFSAAFTIIGQCLLEYRRTAHEGSLEKNRLLHEKNLNERQYTQQSFDLETKLLSGRSHIDYSKCVGSIYSYKKKHVNYKPDGYASHFKDNINIDKEVESINECRVVIRDYWLQFYRLRSRSTQSYKLDNATTPILKNRYSQIPDLIKPLDKAIYGDLKNVETDLVYNLFSDTP
jgi:hypothetical protein